MHIHEFAISGLTADPSTIPAMDLLDWAAGALDATVAAGPGVMALVLASPTAACIFDAGDPEVGPLADRLHALGAVAYVLDMRMADGRRYLMTTDRDGGAPVMATIVDGRCARVEDPETVALAPTIIL